MTQQQEKEYTWDDLVAAIGEDFSGGEVQTSADPVEKGAIRRYCEPLELDCPLHHDDEVAKQHGYRGVIAPISGINRTFSYPPIWKPGDPTRYPNADVDARADRQPSGNIRARPLPMPKTTASFATDVEVEYFAPVYVGDVLITRGRKLLSVALRETSVGYGAFTVFESEIRNQNGELVAQVRTGGYAYNPHPKK
jgi:hypothetical protein